MTVEMTMHDETDKSTVQFLTDDKIKIGGKEGEPDAILIRAR